MMLPGGAYYAQKRKEERERAAESLLTPDHNSPGTPEPAAPPAHHRQNPDTPVKWRSDGDAGRLLTDEPEFGYYI